MRYSRAFSAFELVCVIVIVAILFGVGLRTMGNMSQKSCMIKLKSHLTHAQKSLSEYYAQIFLASSKANPSVARAILASLPNDVSCGFSLQASSLLAHIGENTLVFSIEPASLEYNPRIFCALQNPLCKQMSDRILDK